ncbi:MAG TPA: hypothetical protein VFX86_02405 [Candidatus Saccharimonadales bacterium]|nr:hypothetical protein [Candidatus Saccharimonadales bacterium]
MDSIIIRHDSGVNPETAKEPATTETVPVAERQLGYGASVLREESGQRSGPKEVSRVAIEGEIVIPNPFTDPDIARANVTLAYERRKLLA